MSLTINSLIIETTRKCNLRCSHCLRGSIQNVNIDKRYIRTLLKQVDTIGNVTFTGGEPSLNVEALEYFVKVAKELKIDIGTFYIVTNGKNIKIDFIIAVLKLYDICWDKENCSLQVSNDLYHREHAEYDDSLLQGLAFYTKRNANDNATYNLINEGRAKKLSGARFYDFTAEINVKEDFEEIEFYLNVNGQIINGCNWSYTNQKKYVIVENVKDITKFYENLPEYLED